MTIYCRYCGYPIVKRVVGWTHVTPPDIFSQRRRHVARPLIG